MVSRLDESPAKSDRVAHPPDFSRTVPAGVARNPVSEPIVPPTRLFSLFQLLLFDLCVSLLASRLAFAIIMRPGAPYTDTHPFYFYVPSCLYTMVTITCFGASGLYRGVVSRPAIRSTGFPAYFAA